MSTNGRSISEEVFGYIYDTMDGQTWYVQHILNRLYDCGKEIDIQLVNDTVMTSVMEQEVAFLNYYESLTYNQSQLLLAIARETAVESVLSHDFIHRHGLPASSSVSLALKSLTEREFVYKYNGKYNALFGEICQKSASEFCNDTFIANLLMFVFCTCFI